MHPFSTSWKGVEKERGRERVEEEKGGREKVHLEWIG